MSIPVFAARHVYAAVDPSAAVEAVRRAFVDHARGDWLMPSKVYVAVPPDGDFRAMPARGGGYAVLKWVTSFPRNPERGLPTVSGIVLLSDATDGRLLAELDAGALTALRTGAAAVLAAETLGAGDGPAGVVGCGVNGRAIAQTFLARGRDVLLWDADGARAALVAEELGAGVAGSREQALGANAVVTVTPGREILFGPGSLRAGQHVSLMGADGPGKAEIAVEELARSRVVVDEWEQVAPEVILRNPGRVRLFCDEWDQASHAGDLARAVQAGKLGREDVTQLGDVLTGTAEGRQSKHDITIFDSTGLAIQDLGVAALVYERWRVDPSAEAFAGVPQVEVG
jgi:alanine dehydrogenase